MPSVKENPIVNSKTSKQCGRIKKKKKNLELCVATPPKHITRMSWPLMILKQH